MLELRQTVLETAAEASLHKRADRKLPAGDVEAPKAMLLPLAVNNDIEAVTAVDLNGIEMLTLAKNPVTNDYITSQDNDFSNFAIVMQVIASTQDTLGDKYAGLLVTSLGPYLFTSVPVRDSAGNLTGVLMSGTALATLLSDLKAP